MLFTYRPLDVNDLTLGGGPLRVLDTPHTTAKMDLTLEGAESGGDFSFALEYASSLFERDSAALYARCFVQAVAALCAAEGDAQLGTLELLDTDDRLRLLTIPRQTVTPFRNATMDCAKEEDREAKAPVYNLLTAVEASTKNAGGVSYEQAVTLSKENGDNRLYYVAEITPLLVGDKLTGYVCIFKDITALKTSMQQLENSRTRMGSHGVKEP